MFLFKYFQLAQGGSGFTTRAPNYSGWSAADYLTVLSVMIGIILVLLYILSIGSKRRRK